MSKVFDSTVMALIAQRSAARKALAEAEADLERLNVKLHDSPEGTAWTVETRIVGRDLKIIISDFSPACGSSTKPT